MKMKQRLLFTRWFKSDTAWLQIGLVSVMLAAPALTAAQTPAAEPEGVVVSTGESTLLDNQDVGQLQRIRQQARPFGHTLFAGGFGNSETYGINPQYLVSPGDRVSIRIWGATRFEDLQTVDSQGNIFIPDVGPVKLGGVPNSQVNATVKQAISRVYTNDVEVYTNLATAQTVSVYVTGYVHRPGKYAGVPSSSVLNFLDKAGGIEVESGSFRTIEIVRQSKVVARVDLYEFIQAGRISDITLKDGDAIVVKPVMNTFTVHGEAARAFRFEFTGRALNGSDVIALAAPRAGATHVAVSRISAGENVFEYLPLSAFDSLEIGNGDIVSFRSDLHDRNITVNIEGSYVGASALTVGRSTTLRQALDLIEVNPDLSAYEHIHIKRRSIAKRQKQSIEDSLKRLESEFLTASSSTDEEARIRSQEAKLITEFVESVSRIEPQGTLVVSTTSGLADIVLENDDVVYIPQRNPSVLVSGQVRLPRAFLWQRGLDADDYVSRAGGLANNADPKSILVVKQDGRVVSAESVAIEPGDELLVLPVAPSKNLQLSATITDIVYKIAVATRVALAL